MTKCRITWKNVGEVSESLRGGFEIYLRLIFNNTRIFYSRRLIRGRVIPLFSISPVSYQNKLYHVLEVSWNSVPGLFRAVVWGENEVEMIYFDPSGSITTPYPLEKIGSPAISPDASMAVVAGMAESHIEH